MLVSVLNALAVGEPESIRDADEGGLALFVAVDGAVTVRKVTVGVVCDERERDALPDDEPLEL